MEFDGTEYESKVEGTSCPAVQQGEDGDTAANVGCHVALNVGQILNMHSTR